MTKNNNNNVEKAITYDSTRSMDVKEMAAATRDEYLELLSPVYSKEQLKDLDAEDLKELLDEVIDRVYRVNMNSGGKPIKPIVVLELQQHLDKHGQAKRRKLSTNSSTNLAAVVPYESITEIVSPPPSSPESIKTETTTAHVV